MSKVKEQWGEKDQFFDADDETDRKQDGGKTKAKAKEQEQRGKDQRLPSRLPPYTTRLYHSAQKRKRDLERIDQENRALMKRLDTTKPSRGMGRTEQLADYDRQAPYRGLPAPGPSNLEDAPTTTHFKLMVKSHYSQAKMTGFLQ